MPKISPETKKQKYNLRCTFTEPELLKLGKSLGDRTLELAALENDKKRVVKDFDAKISSVEADISVLTNQVTSGYEFRMVTCTEILGKPEAGRKSVIRDDTNEMIGIYDMTQEELQRTLPEIEA